MKKSTANQLSFSHEEVKNIREITDKYSKMYVEAMKIQQEISESETRLRNLIEDMEALKQHEYDLFMNLAASKNLEPQTIAKAAANYILSEKQ
jgi:uncharacterized protein YaaN involved in tellurite resistance